MRCARHRLPSILLTLATLAASTARAQSIPGATDITAAQVQQFLKDLPPNVASDKAVRVVDVGGYRVGIYGTMRPKASPGDAISHETSATEIYLILEGSGQLVTGGRLREPITRYKSREIGGRATARSSWIVGSRVVQRASPTRHGLDAGPGAYVRLLAAFDSRP